MQGWLGLANWFPSKPLACVMGDMDLVRALGLAGIRCAVVTRPGGPTLYSRFTRTALCWEDFSEPADEAVEVLVRFGAAQPEPPALFYDTDSQVLLVSRYRERLAKAFRFVIADPVLVEDLVDKSRFQVLAERLRLPVPATRRINPIAGTSPVDVDLRFPVILKPLMRRKPWNAIGGSGKARQLDTPEALRELWPRLVSVGMPLMVQEMIPGPESCIESYHVYVDQQGQIVADFTGRKLRTYPEFGGDSTALTITDAPDLSAQGRELVQRLNLRGVAKLDFKRGPDGRLHLLEVNPRFNLWHHLGAIAGVNLPALVYADLTGQPRPAVRHARVGFRWCKIWSDLPAARACGVPLVRWLPWVLTCEAKSAVSWDDPMPLLRAGLFRLLSRRTVPEAQRPTSPRKQAAS
jgi:predicted ATP-grasp superfamily ATP-dependent carboligase